jgi:hypothetical protein
LRLGWSLGFREWNGKGDAPCLDHGLAIGHRVACRDRGRQNFRPGTRLSFAVSKLSPMPTLKLPEITVTFSLEKSGEPTETLA